MNKIYERSEDLHVRATIIYVGDDDKAYEDPDCTVGISAENLQNLFLKGVVVMHPDGFMLKPFACAMSGDAVVLTATVGSDVLSFYSMEHQGK